MCRRQPVPVGAVVIGDEEPVTLLAAPHDRRIEGRSRPRREGDRRDAQAGQVVADRAPRGGAVACLPDPGAADLARVT